MTKAKGLVISLSGLIGLTGLLFWRYYLVQEKPSLYMEVASWDLPMEAPSGIAADEAAEVFWLTDWKSGAIIKVLASNPVKVLERHASSLTFFHPNSIVLDPGGRYIFTLDSVTHKIYRHQWDKPEVIDEEAPAPSPSSLFMAVYDPPGAPAWRLAALDTLAKSVYLYDPRTLKAKPAIALTLPKGMTPLAFAGGQGAFWILDSKTKAIWKFEQNEKGEWPAVRAGEVALADGSEALTSATAFAIRQDGSVYLVLETAPPKLVLVEKRSKK
ncbi:MAG: hypothetical protein HY401_03330 [Elusimicrobia bacterium]|nr:hypothetical protein [Elusimicrobiota bacterium]